MTKLRLASGKEAAFPTASARAHANCKTRVHRQQRYELATFDSIRALNGRSVTGAGDSCDEVVTVRHNRLDMFVENEVE